MDSPVESYKSGNYEQAQQLLNSQPNKLIECKTLIKLHQLKSPIPLGSCISKTSSDLLTKAQTLSNELQGQDKDVIETILNYFQDKEVKLGGSDEQKFYFGLRQLELQEYEEALKIFNSLGDLENKDDQKHKHLVLAECYISLNQYQKATKILEHVGENSYCYALLSNCYFKLNQQQQGQQWMKEALKINQGCYYALNNQAKNDNIDQQIKVITQFIEKDPTNSRLIREHINALITKGSAQVIKSMGEYACRPRGEFMNKLQEHVQKLPKCNSTLYLQALIHYFNYKNAEALVVFEQCIQNNYRIFDSKFYIALIHKDQFKYKEAVLQFKKLSQEVTGQLKDDCHFWRVVMYIELNELDQALKELEYVKPNPQNYTLISRLYFLKGNKTQADTWLKEALKLDTNCLYAKVEKGTQDAKYDCILLLEQLIKSDPYNMCAKQALVKHLIIHSENSIAYAWGEYSCKPKGKEIQRAVELIQQIKQVRDCVQLEYFDAICKYYLNDLKQSEQLFNYCIEQNHQSWTCKYFMSLIKKDQMKYKECLELSLQVLNHVDQFKQQCHANRAWIFIQQSQPDKAIKELEKSTHGCQYYVLLGQAYIMKGNSVQANTWFNESLKVNPNCLYAKINKAILEQRQDEILKLLEGAQKSDPDNYFITWYRGKVLFRLNKFDQAIQLFEQSINSRYVMAYASKAKVLRVQQKFEEALKTIEQGLTIDEQLPPLFIVKASILYDQKKYEESIQTCNLINDDQNVHALRLKALCLRKLDRKEEALKLYDQILEIDKFSIQSFIGKAQIIKETGDVYDLIQQLSDIVMHKKMYKATINPIVVRNCQDLIRLNQEFEIKGGVIQKVIVHGQNLDKQKQEFEQLTKQKDELCDEKIDCIMNPICHVKVDSTEEILKKLNILYKQMSEMQQKQQTQFYEQQLNNKTFSECSVEEQKIWDSMNKEDLLKQVQQWNQDKQQNDQNKYNYSLVFYNLMLNHLISYGEVQNDKITKNEDVYKMLTLGNSFVILDDMIDNSFTMIKMIKYENRMKSLLKVIKENQLTNKCDNNIQLTIALCAQKCADQIDFTKESQQIQSHAFKYQNKFLKDQIEEYVNKSQIPELQLLSGKYAIKDVIVVICYIQHNFIALINKSKQVPLHDQISEIRNKHFELTTESHPVHQKINEFNSNYTIKDYKVNPMRDKQSGDDGCCTIM
ncbi:unnamed protein product (macronuclear) [Paramecium tetraurelia]|uniref:Tetratricopeptide repeat protein n=1 Tax=Paramecium tetraurelia TaxID=5888 RepID=A0D2F6_PARTE|nr:uncharacterized protein GSPATT00012731001 [Paramecium tetraurelia]CAK77223.1 unnamed protein product [Paramecium tetraurelia]|eukprot:XP_001444620.1 hypothetical protein (macronuclear) [Paramecium tetraurelia strain d4-2]